MSDTIDKKEKLLLEFLFSNETLFIKSYGILDPEYFTPPLDKVVSYVKDHFKKHHTLASMDIVDAETGILLKSREVEPSDESYVLEEVEDHCQRAAMSNAVLSGADLIAEGDISGVQSLVREALMVKIDVRVGLSMFDNPEDRIANSVEDTDERSLGIPALDRLMNNVRRTELAFFVASTGVGKSVTLANIACAMASQGLDSLIVSVEMNEDRYSRRMDSIITGVPLDKDPVDSVAEIVKGLEKARETYGNITTKRVNGRFGLDDLRTLFMEYHLQHGKYPDSFLLDYIDIFSNMNIPKGVNGKFEWDEVKTHGVRDLCEEFNMYGFTASQTNREAYGNITEIGVQHMGGGLSKAQGADTVIFLVATEEDLENNTWTASAGKLRNASVGAMKPITLYRCPNTLKISDQPFMGSNHVSPAIKTTRKAEEKASIKSALSSTSGKDKLKAALRLKGGIK